MPVAILEANLNGKWINSDNVFQVALGHGLNVNILGRFEKKIVVFLNEKTPQFCG